jgi:hypothetical protein
VVYQDDKEVADDFIHFVSEGGTFFETINKKKQDSFSALLSPYLVNSYETKSA